MVEACSDSPSEGGAVAEEADFDSPEEVEVVVVVLVVARSDKPSEEVVVALVESGSSLGAAVEAHVD